MTNEHPIVPPPELVQQLAKEAGYSVASSFHIPDWLVYVLEKAFQAGADQELEAIEKEILDQGWFANPEYRLAQLRAARRPKPPSLKEQALEAFHRNYNPYESEDFGIIRRALESLPDD